MKIKKAIYDDMIEYCRWSLPYEACGILAGKNNFVTEIYKIKNIETSSVSYFMETKEQLKAMKDIRQKGLEMIAIFHSHPFGSAYPSQKDIELAFYDVYYLIVAFEPEFEVKCFKIKDGEIDEEELIIGNEN
ncbi:MAG: M67 family metallopeptidase [Thermodesulfovibrio sp.]|uniref:M67 family metallopeptidase n=1 Tax=unclassified Thermodesulfovibrio TaxID=2645936 RepID=UPI00083B1679|nr:MULTISPECIES: M67 family metallopeptidase [unclassified Thermodesulfovibrio]MDI1471764.1 M67 family metallopeptidase [Thermodesulfovibrio sp. 1176]MDI6713654.1 M67 family metallopeptidase [Thermodesulfovibrio sp.]ODA43243.1 Mov34/MPN/PAD-1 [Thermodesulfovibrio sp. N1]